MPRRHSRRGLRITLFRPLLERRRRRFAEDAVRVQSDPFLEKRAGFGRADPG